MRKTANRLYGVIGKASGALLACALVAACTTTTRSVNEVPGAGQEQSASGQVEQSSQRRGRARSDVSAQDMSQLSPSDMQQLITRDQTRSQQIVQMFGRPDSVMQSGNEQYWNYTHQFRDERRNVGGLKSLTIFFDPSGVVLDYDFQDNTFPLD